MKDIIPETTPTVMGINILLSTHELKQLEKDLTTCELPATNWNWYYRSQFVETDDLYDSPRSGKTRLQELLAELHKVKNYPFKLIGDFK